ncbi:MAG: ABC transporter permease, partial [Myxococcales bacterium]
MKADKLWSFVRVNLSRDRKGAFFSAFGVAMGIGALVFFVALGLGVGTVVRERIFPTDSNAVEVVPPAMSLGSLLGGGKLDEAAVARFAALDGVQQVYRKMELRVPAMGGPADSLVQTFRVPRHIHIALHAVGVEKGYVERDVAKGMTFEDPAQDAPIPAIASRRLLELYNRGFARTQGLVPIGEDMLLAAAGVELLTARVGRSMRGDSGLEERRVGLTFAGLSDRAPLHGVLIPIETAKRLNRLYGKEAEAYSALTLVADSPGRVPALVQQVKAMGFAIDDGEKQMAERVGGAVAVTTGALALLSVLICLLAGVNIAHALSASVRARAKELGLLRALGATGGDVARIVLAEAAVIGLFGGLAGTAAARVAALVLDRVAGKVLPELPFKLDSFFAFPPLLLGGAVALGIA